MHGFRVRVGRRQRRQHILPQLGERRAITRISICGEAPHLMHLVQVSSQLRQGDRRSHANLRERHRERQLR